MKKLLFFKLTVFTTTVLVVISFILVEYGGYIDFFYEKFTSPKAKSLIIGDSRSFQGIQPSIINLQLKKSEFDLPILNYSFTGAQAISGPLYNASIKKKINKKATNGIFIISITPDFLTAKDGFDNEKGEFREYNQPPHNMHFVSLNPNFEYFFKNLSYFHFKGIFKKNSFVHKDGWLEESNLPKDSLVLNRWKEHQINLFLKDRKKYKLSKTRIISLIDLISYLKEKGSVFLIRMPIGNDFLKLEQKYYTNLNTIIDSISNLKQVPYFNFNLNTEKHYKTYDGHHIDKYDGKRFSKDLCDSIIKWKKHPKN